MAKTANGIDAEVGRRVRDRRRALGVSQAWLAERLGITFQQVQKYEKGANRISAGRLMRISQILKMPVATLFGEDRTGGDGSSPQDPLIKFLETREGQDLNLAFAAIDDVGLRRRIIDVVRAIGARDAVA